MMIPFKHFLLTFDRNTGAPATVETFECQEVAIDRLEQAEHKYAGVEHMEVVLLSSDSIETLKHTHGHYFFGRDMDYVKLLGA